MDSTWVFTYRDHLGSPRVWFTDVNGDGVIKAEDDVLETVTAYPFGMFAFGSKAEGYESDRRDFTGHELVGATENPSSRYQSVLDAGARTYIPGLGIFAQTDPLSTQPNQVAYTPYHYTFNDPINFSDPTGLAPATFGTGRSNGELGSTSADLAITDPRGWDGVACPPGADCPGSADNKGIIRDPSDSEVGRDAPRAGGVHVRRGDRRERDRQRGRGLHGGGDHGGESPCRARGGLSDSDDYERGGR